MRRRTFLASGLALAGAASAAGCSGILGDEATGGDLPGTDPDPEVTRAGLAPDPEDVPAPDVDVDALEENTDYGEAVPLLPIDAAYDLYRRRELRVVDARSLRAYQASHVAGAVHSPAPEGYDADDPTGAWPPEERILTYCTCPHHLSTWRAAHLIASGHDAVFALDEGFAPWYDRGYPIASSASEASIGEARTVRGRVDPALAGETVWVRHEPTGQREPGEVAADGSFAVEIRFVEVGSETPLTVETPAWTETAPLAAWTDGTAR